MKPSKSILDRSFAYVNSAKTDIRETFRRAIAEREEQRKRDEMERQSKVRPMRKL